VGGVVDAEGGCGRSGQVVADAADVGSAVDDRDGDRPVSVDDVDRRAAGEGEVGDAEQLGREDLAAGRPAAVVAGSEDRRDDGPVDVAALAVVARNMKRPMCGGRRATVNAPIEFVLPLASCFQPWLALKYSIRTRRSASRTVS
jgi:hypothetical protein